MCLVSHMIVPLRATRSGTLPQSRLAQLGALYIFNAIILGCILSFMASESDVAAQASHVHCAQFIGCAPRLSWFMGSDWSFSESLPQRKV